MVHRYQVGCQLDHAATCFAEWNTKAPSRYGVKMEAIALVEEWVQTIGSQAGLTAQNTTILSGAIGVPESRLEASAPHSVFAPLLTYLAYFALLMFHTCRSPQHCCASGSNSALFSAKRHPDGT